MPAIGKPQVSPLLSLNDEGTESAEVATSADAGCLTLRRLEMAKSGKNPKCSFFYYKIRSGTKE